MTTDELVAEAYRLGISLIPHGEKLRVEAPMGSLTQELRQALRENKAELIALLTEPSSTETLLARLRKGHGWLLSQHKRWQLGDFTAADDASF